MRECSRKRSFRNYGKVEAAELEALAETVKGEECLVGGENQSAANQHDGVADDQVDHRSLGFGSCRKTTAFDINSAEQRHRQGEDEYNRHATENYGCTFVPESDDQQEAAEDFYPGQEQRKEVDDATGKNVIVVDDAGEQIRMCNLGDGSIDKHDTDRQPDQEDQIFVS